MGSQVAELWKWISIQFKMMYRSLLFILTLQLFISSCDREPEEFSRSVVFRLNGEYMRMDHSQGGYYLNNRDGMVSPSWEIRTTGSPRLTIIAEDTNAAVLHKEYEFPNASATLSIFEEQSSAPYKETIYEAIEGKITIDGYRDFTRWGTFEFAMISQSTGDTIHITDGQYELTTTDQVERKL